MVGAPRLWALVPAKSFGRAKSRLAGVLDDRARAELAARMLDTVLAALTSSPSVDRVLVVTDGEDVAKVAEAHGAEVVADRDVLAHAPAEEPREPGLGALVAASMNELTRRGATRGLVVMADLPELTRAEVTTLAEATARADLVIAPDLKSEGTNALGLGRLDGALTAFGHPNSFARHVARGREAGLDVVVHRSDGVGFDVDEPADLSRVRP